MAAAIDAGSSGSASSGRPAGRLRHRAAVGRDHRAPAGHRLEDRQAEGLVVRGVHERGRGAVERQRLVVRDPADPHDVVVDAQLGGEGVQLGGVRGIRRAADDDEPVVRAGRAGPGRTPAAGRRSSCTPTATRRRGRTDPRCRAPAAGAPRPPRAVTGPEHLVVDGLGDEPELGRVDVEVGLDLPAQALGVDDDGVRHLRGVRVAGAPVQPDQGVERPGARERVQRLEVRHESRSRLDQRRDEGVEDVDTRPRQPQRGVRVLAQRPQGAPFVRPGEGDVPDSGTVPGVLARGCAG